MRSPSLIDRLRSWRHGFWFGISRRVRWSRGVYREKPAGELKLDAAATERVLALRGRYRVQFELALSRRGSLTNYEYLDILDGAWERWGGGRSTGGRVCDVGCASFSYAAALHSFFRPDRLTGIEVEGYRLFRDGRARIDYAAGYVAGLANTQFVVADYAHCKHPADIITAWFPFVTSNAILAWRLPLSLLEPDALFASISRNLAPSGTFVIVNHGLGEAEIAGECCIAAGLCALGRWAHQGSLSRYRALPPVISLWRHAQRTVRT